MRPARFLVAVVAVLAATARATQPATSIDLARAFGTRAPWRFTAAQGPDIPDPLSEPGDKAPGAITPCISRDGGRTCTPDLTRLLVIDGVPDDLYAQPHFLTDARIVQPRPSTKLLLVQLASLHSVNGNQRIATAAFAYDRAGDHFRQIYARQIGRNNNEEIRYIAAGPLRGAIVAAEPTRNAPFGYWIAVARLGNARYGEVLRYRSATRYGDGNPLAVIDAEMPTIQRRLGLWHAGMRLPTPAGQCRHPHLVRLALWC